MCSPVLAKKITHLREYWDLVNKNNQFLDLEAVQILVNAMASEDYLASLQVVDQWLSLVSDMGHRSLQDFFSDVIRPCMGPLLFDDATGVAEVMGADDLLSPLSPVMSPGFRDALSPSALEALSQEQQRPGLFPPIMDAGDFGSTSGHTSRYQKMTAPSFYQTVISDTSHEYVQLLRNLFDTDAEFVQSQIMICDACFQGWWSNSDPTSVPDQFLEQCALHDLCPLACVVYSVWKTVTDALLHERIFDEYFGAALILSQLYEGLAGAHLYSKEMQEVAFPLFKTYVDDFLEFSTVKTFQRALETICAVFLKCVNHQWLVTGKHGPASSFQATLPSYLHSYIAEIANQLSIELENLLSAMSTSEAHRTSRSMLTVMQLEVLDPLVGSKQLFDKVRFALQRFCPS